MCGTADGPLPSKHGRVLALSRRPPDPLTRCGDDVIGQARQPSHGITEIRMRRGLVEHMLDQLLIGLKDAAVPPPG